MRTRGPNPGQTDTIPVEGIVAVACYLFGLLGVLAGRFLLGFGWVTSVLLFFPAYGLSCGVVNNESRRMTAAACALLMFPVLAVGGPLLAARLKATLPTLDASGGMTGGVLLESCVMATLFCVLTGIARLLSACFGLWRMPDRIHAALMRTWLVFVSAAAFYGIGIGGGMLLYGPPGTGKTFIAKAVAGELGLPFYAITAADVFGRYVGESERNIRKIFADIRKNRLSVVFVDELETLFPKRTRDVEESTRKVISVLLQELDGIDGGRNPVLLLGATNVPWMIDEAFMRPGRFDVKVFVGLPDFNARRQMLIAAFDEGDVPHEPGLTAHMAEKTEGFSGADLRGVMARLRQMAFDRRLQQYTYDLSDEVLSASSPATNVETVRRIREWEASSC